MASYWTADYDEANRQLVAAARKRCTKDDKCARGAYCRPHPRKKKPMTPKVYKHKGAVLVPLTETLAMSLDKADVIKHIAGENRVGASDRFFSTFKRRNYKLPDKPTYLPGKKILRIKLNYYDNIDVPIDHIALVERGDPTLYYFNQAVRYLPMNLKGFKRDLGDAIAAMKRKTDHYIERLPLHRKLELFRKLTPQEQRIYDFLYKGDVDELMKPDDDE